MRKIVPPLKMGADRVEELLLEAARHDGPANAHARARTIDALRTLASGATGVAARSSGSAWARFFGWVANKWVVIGAVAVAAVSTGGALLVGRSPLVETGRSVDGAPSAGRAPPVGTVADIGRGRDIEKAAAPRASAARSVALHSDDPTGVRVPGPGPAREIVHPAEPNPMGSTRGQDATTRSAGRSTSAETAVGKAIDSAPLSVTEARPGSDPVHSTAVDPMPSSPSPSASVELATTEPATPLPSSGSAPPSSPLESAAPPAPTPLTAPSLRDEIAVLEAVRVSLAATDAASALAALDRYAARFPSGVLADEAAVLRAQALMAAGRRDDARRWVERFAREHPTSPYVRRMTRLLRTAHREDGF